VLRRPREAAARVGRGAPEAVFTRCDCAAASDFARLAASARAIDTSAGAARDALIRAEREASHARIVIAHLRREFRIHVHDVVAGDARARARADEHLIEHLRVALKHVRIALVQRQCFDQRGQACTCEHADRR